MDKFDAKKIWEQIKENSRKLDLCERHDFSIDLTPEKLMDKKFKCTKCGGEVDSLRKLWYEKGVEHASKQIL